MRLLTDAQVPFDLVRALRALEPLLGWTIETVYDLGIDEEGNDARLVRRARSRASSLLTLDDFRGYQGPEVAAEIRDHGGVYVCISGGPEQGWQRALGKLIFHSQEIEAWAATNEGVIVVRDLKPVAFIDRHDQSLANRAARRIGEEAFDAYIAARDVARGTTRRRTVRSPVPPVEQSSLDIDEPS